jgi:hypothetical protein
MKDETKEKASKIWKDIKAGLKSGFDITKKGLSKAGSTIQTYSDLGVVQLEKKQFESKRKKAYEVLGLIAFERLSAKGAVSLKADDPDTAALIGEIAALNKEIAKRDTILKAAEKEGKIPSSEPKKKAAAKKAPAKKNAKKAPAKKAD